MKRGIPLDEFTKAHDPLYVDASPVPVFDWKPEKGRTRFLVVAATNATPVVPKWWRVLRNVAEQTGAQLCVLPIRYKNPTSRWTGSQDGREWWCKEVRPYLCNVRVQLNQNLVILGDIKIQPTAADPVGAGDLAAVSRDCSAIIGHPKIQTRSIATPQNRMAKLLMTSGVCTEANYSDTRAGRVGDFHHSLSAVLVEVDGKRFYMRRLHFDAKTGTCTDSAAATRYNTTRSFVAPPALAVVCGDLHLDFADPKAVAATDDMCEASSARHVIWHDAADGYTVNHHHGRNPFNRRAKYIGKRDNVRAELERLQEFYRARPGSQHIIVAANHTDDFLTRWVIEKDWRDDPVNGGFYLETALAMWNATRLGKGGTEYPSPFKYWMDRARIDNVRVLDRDESFVLAGVALDLHGDKGPNGARGSIRNLRRIGVKSMIGHGHSPGEDEGATQVGHLGYKFEYVSGPSSQLHANAILGDDGKRQLVVIVDGEYRLR